MSGHVELVRFVCVAQLSGIVDPGAHTSATFANYEDALGWVTSHLSAAHDPSDIKELVDENFAPYALFGHPEIKIVDVAPNVKQAIHSGGPTTAWIIEVEP